MSKERSKRDSGQNTGSYYRERERCHNPWNGSCENTDIALYIFYEGEKLPICRLCWHKIAYQNFEWGENIGL